MVVLIYCIVVILHQMASTMIQGVLSVVATDIRVVIIIIAKARKWVICCRHDRR